MAFWHNQIPTAQDGVFCCLPTNSNCCVTGSVLEKNLNFFLLSIILGERGVLPEPRESFRIIKCPQSAILTRDKEGESFLVKFWRKGKCPRCWVSEQWCNSNVGSAYTGPFVLSTELLELCLPFLDKISYVPLTIKCFLSHLSRAVNGTHP